MQVEDIQSLYGTIKNALKFVSKSYFLIFSISLAIITNMYGYDLVFRFTNNPIIFFGIPLGLIAVGFITVNHDLKQWKNQQKIIKTSYVVAIVVFLFMSMYTEVIFYIIHMVDIGIHTFGSEEMKSSSEYLFHNANIISAFSIFNYPIFFKGKQIWKWITKRDEIITKYELSQNRLFD